MYDFGFRNRSMLFQLRQARKSAFCNASSMSERDKSAWRILSAFSATLRNATISASFAAPIFLHSSRIAPNSEFPRESELTPFVAMPTNTLPRARGNKPEYWFFMEHLGVNRSILE